MFEVFKNFFNRFKKKELAQLNSGEAAKERLNLVLMQDRANVSADYIDLMRQDIIDDIKKYIDIDEKEIDLKLTNQIKNDGSNGFPALYANIPINRIKSEKKANDIVIEKNLNDANHNEIKKTIVDIAEKKKRKTKKEIVDDGAKIEVKNNEESKVIKKKASTKVSTKKVEKKESSEPAVKEKTKVTRKKAESTSKKK